MSSADQIKSKLKNIFFFIIFSVYSDNIKYIHDRELDLLLLLKTLF